MSRSFPDPWWDNERLGQLARQFRGTRDQVERQAIAKEYAAEVDRLIRRGAWDEVPAFEDELPDDWMPQAYFDYWSVE